MATEPCTVSGNVSDLTGTAIPSAVIVFTRDYVAGQDGSAIVPFNKSVTTDGSGGFQVDLMPGSYMAATSIDRGAISFRVFVPDEASGVFANMIDGPDTDITPAILTAALAAQAAAEAARDVAVSATFSVTLFGAIGDGATDDAAAITAAVAAAEAANARLYWPDGDYLCSSTIPNLHSVGHFGAGRIKVGSEYFPVQPLKTASNPYLVAPDDSDVTNTLYVSAGGSDTNDGLSSARPLATLNRAFNILANYGPTLGGMWKIKLAAGTYSANNIANRKFASPNALFIEGTRTGAAYTEPTAIIDGTDRSTDGIQFNYYQSVYLKDLKTYRCDNGVLVSRHCAATFDNVWSEDDNVGRTILYNSHHISKGGSILGALELGVQELFNCTHAYNADASNYLVIDGEGVTPTGWQSKECCSGHVDHVEIMDCTECEFELQSMCTANVGGMKLGGGSSASPIGILVANSEIHDYDQVVFNGTNPPTQRVRKVGNAVITDEYEWDGVATNLVAGTPAPIQVDANYSTVQINDAGGAAANTSVTLISWDSQDNTFRVPGRKYLFRVHGFVNGAETTGPTTDTCRILLYVAGAFAQDVDLPSGLEDVPFTVTFELTIRAAGDQHLLTRCEWGGGSITKSQLLTSSDTGTTQFNLYARRTVDTDDFLVYLTEVFA